ncbi:MAG: hypothetical protein ACYDEQ_10935, partial [Desulfocucumaceae bacterium]
MKSKMNSRLNRVLVSLAVVFLLASCSYAAAGLDLKTRIIADPCANGGFRLQFAIINNTGAPVSGPFNIVTWFDNPGTYLVNSPQVNGNYTDPYPSTGGWNQQGSVGALVQTAFACPEDHATIQISVPFTPTNPISAGGWMAGSMEIYLNGWINPFDGGCDDYSSPPLDLTTYHDYSHVALFRGGVLEDEWLDTGGTVDPATGVLP